ncbi:phosphatase PAP2 family protein, partial [Xanthovirga aplysinae]|uniref:phosphatase PAP2 family protein n=1 Tax=Xanthovirga aplysinae TaxID=2529853 RepID=UPI0012BCC166
KHWFPFNFYRIEDYVQYAPFIILFSLKLLGFQSLSEIRNLALFFVLSAALGLIITHSLKEITDMARPPGKGIYSSLSFPSGHTCTAFIGATLLFKEYGRLHLFIGILAFTLSIFVGISRIINHEHWFP